MLINRWNLSDYESTALWELYGTETGIAIQSTINELKDSFAKSFYNREDFMPLIKNWE
jgi:hypothetical protein